DIRITKHRIKRRRAAAAPTPNRDPRRVDKRPLVDRPDCIRLVLRTDDPYFAIDDLAPAAAARRRRAAIVDAHHDVTLLREQPVPHKVKAAPLIEYRLSGRFAIDVEQNRIALIRIEIGRLDHPAIKLHAFANVDPKEL